MRNDKTSMWTALLTITTAVLLSVTPAHASFGVDWGNSNDTGLNQFTGDQLIAQWLVDNNYYNNPTEAQNFALNGYIGAGVNDPDPFTWAAHLPYNVEIVQENAHYADQNTLGFYTGSGAGLTTTQLLGGTENGPRTFSAASPFGFYLATPENNTWFTDRALNTDQVGSLRRTGGNAQALIYELNPNQEWLVAWEDLDATKLSSDREFNDMYLKVTVAPEPIASTLFVLGGAALTARRRFKKKA